MDDREVVGRLLTDAGKNPNGPIFSHAESSSDGRQWSSDGGGRIAHLAGLLFKMDTANGLGFFRRT